MLDALMGQAVVVDLRGPFVCLGTLQSADDHFLELRDADLRDSDTNREHYVAASRAGGVMRNRKRVLLVRAEVVAVTLLKDVIAG
jgi:small nuclear ribonucleoprotein (snRNP)-like protein